MINQDAWASYDYNVNITGLTPCTDNFMYIIVKLVQTNFCIKFSQNMLYRTRLLIYKGDFLYKFFSKETLPLEVSLHTISLFYATHEHCVDSVSAIHCRYKAFYHFLKTKITQEFY